MKLHNKTIATFRTIVMIALSFSCGGLQIREDKFEGGTVVTDTFLIGSLMEGFYGKWKNVIKNNTSEIEVVVETQSEIRLLPLTKVMVSVDGKIYPIEFTSEVDQGVQTSTENRQANVYDETGYNLGSVNYKEKVNQMVYLRRTYLKINDNLARAMAKAETIIFRFSTVKEDTDIEPFDQQFVRLQTFLNAGLD